MLGLAQGFPDFVGILRECVKGDGGGLQFGHARKLLFDVVTGPLAGGLRQDLDAVGLALGLQLDGVGLDGKGDHAASSSRRRRASTMAIRSPIHRITGTAMELPSAL